MLDEAVLRRPFGSATELCDQLDRLLSASRRPAVSLRIVPFSAALYAGLPGPFTVLQYADDRDRDVVAVESHTGERLLEQPSSVLERLSIFDEITRKALDHDGSRSLITDIRNHHSPKDTP